MSEVAHSLVGHRGVVGVWEGGLLTFPTPPAWGEVKERNRKKGLAVLEELYRNSSVALTNMSAAEQGSHWVAVLEYTFSPAAV